MKSSPPLMLHASMLALLLFLPESGRKGEGKATGELKVTALVTSSVSITIGADGRRTVVVANAPGDEAALAAVASENSAVVLQKPAMERKAGRAAHNKSRKHPAARPKSATGPNQHQGF